MAIQIEEHAAPNPIEASNVNLFGHPKGLFILFFTEMWERFSYYGMRAILVLFLTSKTNGGLSWTDKNALMLYGIYTMLVYVMGIPGGIIADKVLGQRKSVMVGGGLLVAGHLLMAYTATWAFFAALLLIVMGVGLLKPNISTMVGGLYRSGDPKRDSGFIIFYMGINIGAFLSSLVVGYVGENIGWHYGFALAGIGMLFGQMVYAAGQKHIRHVGNLISKNQNDATSKVPFSKAEKDRIKVLLVSFLIVLVFWAAFEQAGGFMNLYTKNFTDRFITKEITVDQYVTTDKSAASKQAIDQAKLIIDEKNSFEINSVNDFITNLFNPIPLSREEIEGKIGSLPSSDSGKNPSDLLSVSTLTIPKSNFDYDSYNAITSEEAIILEEDNAYKLLDLNNTQSGFMIPASWFQSLNALFIIIFGGIFAWFWVFLAKRNKEPSTISKFGLSTIILGVGFLLMVFASVEKSTHIFGKSNMIWLVGAYLFHTLGELCISPIALSFITKVAPKRIVATMMGIYFAVTGFGNFLAAWIGSYAENFGDFTIFLFLTIFPVIIGLILLLFAPKLMKLTHGVEKGESQGAISESESKEIGTQEEAQAAREKLEKAVQETDELTFNKKEH